MSAFAVAIGAKPTSQLVDQTSAFDMAAKRDNQTDPNAWRRWPDCCPLAGVSRYDYRADGAGISGCPVDWGGVLRGATVRG